MASTEVVPEAEDDVPSRRQRTVPEWMGAVVGTLVIGAILTVLAPNFMSTRNLLNVLAQVSVFGFMAAGQTFVMIARGIDLSVAATGALAGTVVGVLSIEHGFSGGTSVLIAILVAMFVGLVHGVLVAYGRLPAFIVTLGGLSVWRGAALELTGGINNTGLPDLVTWLARGQIGPVPVPVLLMIVVFAACGFVLTRTRWGMNLYAIGGDEEAAVRAGVPVKRYTTFAYMACSSLSAIGGIILVGRLDSAGGSVAAGYELNVIAAVVIGGTSLFGGVGSVWGAFFGAFLMGIIQNGMNLMGISSFIQMMVLGSIIVLAIGADVMRKRYAKQGG
ncbi:MAG: ABC transporter permease [Nitriliruptoraceae bacterium]|nr:ABC transporter permease [Nitriliruptoraceae bacterium]